MLRWISGSYGRGGGGGRGGLLQSDLQRCQRHQRYLPQGEFLTRRHYGR